MALASLSHTSVQRRGRVLAGPLTLSLHEGDFVGVVGPNGAGKTTLLKLLAGQVRPSSGICRFRGEDIWQQGAARDALRRSLGYLLQRHEFHLQAPFRVADVVAFGRAGLPRLKADERADAVQAALRRVGMPDMASRLFGELSGGQQQKVHLARVIVREAPLLLLDEPGAGLDPDKEANLTRQVQDLHSEGGRTVVMVTHRLSALPSCCNRVILLRQGRIMADGPPEKVMTAPMLSQLYGCRMDVVRREGRCHVVAVDAPPVPSHDSEEGA